MGASKKTANLKLPLYEGQDTTTWLRDFNGAMAIIDKLIDVFYPVGAYFQTSDEDFDPNTAWGGTWVEDTAGRFLVAKNDGKFNTVGGTGGEETHKLTADELPKLSGETQLKPYDGYTASGIVQNINYQGQTKMGAENVSAQTPYGFKISFGGDQAHNNLPPYKVVKCWHRIQ